MTLREPEPELPELSAVEEERLTELLQSASRPKAIDLERHERLLGAALEDPFAAPSPEEVVASERLRRALSGAGNAADLDWVLARALAAAHAPSALAAEHAFPAALTPARATRRAAGSVFYVRFAAALAGLAAAAGLFLAVGSRRAQAPALGLPALALAQSRSTAALFQSAALEPPSARIDRIASVRERDLRANRYAQWGVR